MDISRTPLSNSRIRWCCPSAPVSQIKGIEFAWKSLTYPLNRSISRYNSFKILSTSVRNLNMSKSSPESLFCYDKPVPEEIIEKPVGLSLHKKDIGSKLPCVDCEAKGALLCATCAGSGLYVDAILESQGILVKVRCLGCGGTGNIMCLRCGGRGHI